MRHLDQQIIIIYIFYLKYSRRMLKHITIQRYQQDRDNVYIFSSNKFSTHNKQIDIIVLKKMSK